MACTTEVAYDHEALRLQCLSFSNPLTYSLFFLVALVVFGPKRLLEMSRGLGQTIQRLQDYKEELKDELTIATKDESATKPSPEKKG
jgi:Sec-independent protein translocase protein TatA